MLPSLSSTESAEEPLEVIPVLSVWVRGALVGVVLGLAVVFVIALRLNPYTEDGSARSMETHRQLGLPPCTFYLRTSLPCPSCGMTTSFALLMHGDLWSSLKANFVGTMLATLGLAFIPWGLACAIAGRTYFVLSLERGLIAVIVTFLSLLLFRWAIVLGVIWLSRLTG